MIPDPHIQLLMVQVFFVIAACCSPVDMTSHLWGSQPDSILQRGMISGGQTKNTSNSENSQIAKKKQQLKISGVYQPNSLHFRVAKLRHVRRHLMGSPSSEAQVDSVQA